MISIVGINSFAPVQVQQARDFSRHIISSWILCLMFSVVGGLSPALAYWREVTAFAANFPSPRANLTALHLMCSMPFTTLPFDLMANSDHFLAVGGRAADILRYRV